MGTLKLVLKGCTLRDQDDLSGIEAGDTVLAVTAPQPPPERVASLVDSRADGDEDDEVCICMSSLYSIQAISCLFSRHQAAAMIQERAMMQLWVSLV